MPVADTVVVELEARVGKLEADLRRAENAFSRTKRKVKDDALDVESAGYKMGTAMRKGFDLARTAAVAYLGVLSVSRIVDWTKAGLEYASSLKEQASALGVTARSMQEYHYAASQVGLTTEEMDQALAMLSRRVGLAATGNEKMASSFRALGINIRNANGTFKDAGELIPDIAEAIERIPNPTQQAAVAVQYFGRSGMRMLPMLQQGRAGINGLRQAANNLGLVLEDQLIDQADAAADKMSELKQVLMTRMASVVAENAGSIYKLADALATVASAAISAAGAVASFVSKSRAEGQWRQRSMDIWDKKYPNASASQRAAASNAINAEISRRLGYGQGSGGLFNVRRSNGPLKGVILPKALRPGGDVTPQTAPRVTVGGGLDVGGLNGGSSARAAGDAAGAAAHVTMKTAAEVGIELARLVSDLSEARAELSGSIHDRAEAERERIRVSAEADRENYRTDETITAADKARLIAAVNEREAAEIAAAERREQADLEEQTTQARRDYFQAQSDLAQMEIDALQAQAQAAPTTRERMAIERRILAAQQEEERNRLEMAILTGEIKEADANRARNAMKARQAGERSAQEIDQEGPGLRYLRSIRDEAANLQDAYEDLGVRGFQRLEESIAGATQEVFGLHGALGDIIGDFVQLAIRQQILGPLADLIFGGGGGGGLLGSLFGGGGGKNIANIGKRAAGGPVTGNRPYIVGEAGRELFVPGTSGMIVPNGMLRGGSGGVVEVHVFGGEMFETRVASISGDVSARVVQIATPAIADVAAARMIGQMGRPKL